MIWSRNKQSPALRKENKIPSPRRKVILRVLLFLLIGGLITLCIYGVWKITRLPFFTIISVSVVGGETIGTKKVEETVNAELLGAYYRLVPKRFLYFYPEQKIEDAIRRIPRVESAAVERDGRNVAVAFTEYEPFALWCKQIKDSECLFLDRFGYAFTPAPKLEGGAYLRLVDGNRTPEVGETILNPEYVRGAAAFTEAVYDLLDLHLVALKHEDENTTYYIAGGGELRTSLSISFEETLRNLQTIIESKEFDHLTPGNFDYIDLRYGKKVFVKEGLEDYVASSTEETIE